MKFLRDDVRVLDGLVPVDRNDPASAASAVWLSVPTRFSPKARSVMAYFDYTAFIFEYKGRLVVTDESLWLTDHGDGSMGNPLGCPRFECDSWSELEEWLEAVYVDLLDDGEIEEVA